MGPEGSRGLEKGQERTEPEGSRSIEMSWKSETRCVTRGARKDWNQQGPEAQRRTGENPEKGLSGIPKRFESPDRGQAYWLEISDNNDF